MIDQLVANGWHLRIEKLVRAQEASSEPEPDLFLVRGEADGYGAGI